MPSALRFRRYHFDAQIGVAKAKLVRGDARAARSAADAVLIELHQLGEPALFADRQAEALMVRGRSYAAADNCAQARADWTLAAGKLHSFEDADGYRGRYLAQLRGSCGKS